MAVKIGPPVAPVRTPDIRRAERQLGFKLPPDYIEFPRRANGAIPEQNIFTVGREDIGSVNAFVPLEELADEYEMVKEELGSRMLPIAHSEGGNSVCLAREGQGRRSGVLLRS